MRQRNSMKKILTLIFCMITAPLWIKPAEPTTLFLGTIKFPTTINNEQSTDFCVYYKGVKLKTDWDKHNASTQFSFIESRYAQTLYILICKNFGYKIDLDNTIDYLKITDSNYLCYELQAKRIYDQQDTLISFSWDCTPCRLNDKVIPENTVIFLFNPDLIEGLAVHNWDTNQAMRLIPTIKINQEASAADLLKAVTIAQLTALDLDAIHAKESSEKNKKV